MKNIVMVENIQDIESVINNYDQIINEMKCTIISNNEEFCKKIDIIVQDILDDLRLEL